MTGVRRFVVGATIALTVAGCAKSYGPEVASGEAAYAAIPAASTSALPEYRIGPLDVLSVSVFGEPELTFKEIQVDVGGRLRFPLIGTIDAAGMTSSGLVDDITARLNARYLRDAQVAVTIVSSSSQRITVEGSVAEPGVYEIANGQATLLEAIALAKSPTRTADLREVVVFRMNGEQRTGARFDLVAIREGRAADPALRGGDIVVVGFSQLKGAFRDFLTTAPFFNVFQNF